VIRGANDVTGHKLFGLFAILLAAVGISACEPDEQEEYFNMKREPISDQRTRTFL